MAKQRLEHKRKPKTNPISYKKKDYLGFRIIKKSLF